MPRFSPDAARSRRVWSASARFLAFALGGLLAAASESAVAQGSHLVSASFIDTTCPPCADFYKYANGAWMRGASIPKGASVTSPEMEREREHPESDLVRSIIERAAAGVRRHSLDSASALWPVGASYLACLDTQTIRRQRAQSILGVLQLIDRIRDANDLVKTFGQLEGAHDVAPWIPAVVRDTRSKIRHATLSRRPAARSPDAEAIRAQFASLLGRLTDAASVARRAASLQQRLAAVAPAVKQVDDTISVDPQLTLVQLRALAPHTEWPAYFAALGAPPVSDVHVYHPKYLRSVDSLLASAPLDEWKAWLKWRVVEDVLGDAPEPATDQGRPAECRKLIGDELGWLIAPEYVKLAELPRVVSRAASVIELLRVALRERVASAPWSDSMTRANAIAKVDSMAIVMGHPGRWPSREGLHVQTGRHLENVWAARRWRSVLEWSGAGKPVDRDDWRAPPQNGGADYQRETNSIHISAGAIHNLVDTTADDAAVIGSFGWLVAHEMTHAFDNGGRRFDSGGNLKKWTSDRDDRRFAAEAQKLVDQFNAYIVVDSVHVNGRRTLNENLADLGGLEVAYTALRLALTRSPQHPLIDGFTPEQRFFLSFAQRRARVFAPDRLRNVTAQNVHAPVFHATNGSLSNMPEFYAVWSCKSGDGMYRDPQRRALLW